MSKKLIYDIPLTKIAIRKGIKLPVELNNDLAYLCGVFAGDGSISIEKRNNQYKYYLTYTGNALDEKEFYHEIIAPRLRNVFGIEPKVKHNKRDNTYVSRINSKPIILFLTEIIGLPKGKKYDSSHKSASIAEYYCRHNPEELDKKLKEEIKKNNGE